MYIQSMYPSFDVSQTTKIVRRPANPVLDQRGLGCNYGMWLAEWRRIFVVRKTSNKSNVATAPLLHRIRPIEARVNSLP